MSKKKKVINLERKNSCRNGKVGSSLAPRQVSAISSLEYRTGNKLPPKGPTGRCARKESLTFVDQENCLRVVSSERASRDFAEAWGGSQEGKAFGNGGGGLFDGAWEQGRTAFGVTRGVVGQETCRQAVVLGGAQRRSWLTSKHRGVFDRKEKMKVHGNF